MCHYYMYYRYWLGWKIYIPAVMSQANRITKRHQYTPSPCLDTTNQGGRKIGRSCSTREVPSCHYYILCVQRWLQPATLIFELARVHTVCTWHKAKNVPSQAEC